MELIQINPLGLGYHNQPINSVMKFTLIAQIFQKFNKYSFDKLVEKHQFLISTANDA